MVQYSLRLHVLPRQPLLHVHVDSNGMSREAINWLTIELWGTATDLFAVFGSWHTLTVRQK